MEVGAGVGGGVVGVGAGVGTSAGGIVTPGGNVMAGDNVPVPGGSVTPGGRVTAGDNVSVGGGIVTTGVGAGVVGTYRIYVPKKEKQKGMKRFMLSFNRELKT